MTDFVTDVAAGFVAIIFCVSEQSAELAALAVFLLVPSVAALSAFPRAVLVVMAVL